MISKILPLETDVHVWTPMTSPGADRWKSLMTGFCLPYFLRGFVSTHYGVVFSHSSCVVLCNMMFLNLLVSKGDAFSTPKTAFVAQDLAFSF